MTTPTYATPEPGDSDDDYTDDEHAAANGNSGDNVADTIQWYASVESGTVEIIYKH